MPRKSTSHTPSLQSAVDTPHHRQALAKKTSDSFALIQPAADAAEVKRSKTKEKVGFMTILSTSLVTSMAASSLAIPAEMSDLGALAAAGGLLGSMTAAGILACTYGDRIVDRILYGRQLKRLSHREGDVHLRKGLIAPTDFPVEGVRYAQLIVDEPKAQFMVAVQQWKKTSEERLDWHWVAGSQQWFDCYQDAYQVLLTMQENLAANDHLIALIEDFNGQSEPSEMLYSYKHELKPLANKQNVSYGSFFTAPLCLPGYVVRWQLAVSKGVFGIETSIFEQEDSLYPKYYQIADTCQFFASDDIQSALIYSEELALQKEHYRTQALHRMACGKRWKLKPVADKVLAPLTFQNNIEGLDLDVMKVQAYGNKQ